MERVFSLLPLSGLALLVVAGWWLTVGMAVGFDAPAVQIAWRDASFGALFLMWAVMMAAMMLPSFFPTARCHQLLLKNVPRRRALADSVAFAGGYLLLWLVFSAAAALLQQLAAGNGALDLGMTVDGLLAALLLAAAGAFQFSRLKMKCLHGCRHPAFFFLLHWRSGRGGAWRMGLHNGLLCLGCCVWLMLLLFVGGVMDLTCIAALTLYVLAEKTLPLSPPQLRLFTRIAGGILLAAAAWQVAAIF